MKHTTLDKKFQQEITGLFKSTFTASEGEKEGDLIANLVSALCLKTDNQEVICFGTDHEQSIIASIFFTRLKFSTDIQAYMLAPVAVSTKYQGKGVGKALINYGLNELRKRAVQVAITYGDPAFYSKVGFQSLAENIIQAPQKLSMPFGWLGQSLTQAAIPVIDERPTCVEPFDDPVYW